MQSLLCVGSSTKYFMNVMMLMPEKHMTMLVQSKKKRKLEQLMWFGESFGLVPTHLQCYRAREVLPLWFLQCFVVKLACIFI